MNRFGGFGGGANMQAMMRQAQKLKEDMARAQKEIEEATIEGTSGGGMVKVMLSGNKEPISVKISPSVIDASDVEILEDLIVAALKDATVKANDLSAKKMGPFGQIGGF